METVPYSIARKEMRVGDGIGCASDKTLGKIIIAKGGGVDKLSHWATISDDLLMPEQHVRVAEAVRKGMQRNRLSMAYMRAHGELFWLKLGLDDDQRRICLDEIAFVLAKKIKYDTRSTIMALFRPIYLDIKGGFNCSESFWWFMRKCERFAARFVTIRRFIWFGKFIKREIAPKPGNVSTWAELPIVRLDMNA